MKKIKSQIINYKDPVTKRFVPFSAIGNPFKKLIDFLSDIIDIDGKAIFIKDTYNNQVGINTNAIGIHNSVDNAEVSIDTGDIILSNKDGNVDITTHDIMLSNQDGYISFRELNNTANELKKSVSDGKEMLAESITNKGIDTASTDSFSVMAENISNIITSTKNTIAITDKPTVSVGNSETIVSYEKVYSYYYNGVNLPKLPDKILEKYPYVFIRQNGSYYELCCNDVPIYNNTVEQMIAPYPSPSLWDIYKANSGDSSWVYTNGGNDNTGWGYRDGLIWTNSDIHNGSIDGAEIYLHASEIERR